ncbi:MAG: hypothetical protein J5732_02835 [Bacteroidaceae bacterium]|nr:hypothetical protein [Bacteroidaceae bacterium]
MAKYGSTVAKATKEEFNRVWSFLRAMEALFESRSFFSNEEDWHNWDDSDEDKKMLLKIEKELIAGGDEGWDGHPDNRLILYEFMKRKFLCANYSGSIGRILLDCETLIKNVCDPKLDYLEFKPSIMYAERNALGRVENIINSGQQKGRDPQKIIASIKRLIEKSKKEN